MQLKNFKRLLTLSILAFISCAAPIQNLTKTQYLNQTFSSSVLQNGGLALLPITAGAGQEGYRRPLGDSLNSHLSHSLPNGKTIKRQNSMDLLNQHDKVTAYQELIEAYSKTSILNREKVKELRSALGVRFALYCSLQDFSEVSKTSYNVFSGLQSTTTASVIAQCLIFDLETGDVMQEIIGQAKSTADEYSYNRGYEAYAGIISRAVLSQIPGCKVLLPKKTTY